MSNQQKQSSQKQQMNSTPRIQFLRQQQRLQKQRIKKMYEQINIEKQKSERLISQHEERMKKIQQKIHVEGKGGVYQRYDDNDYLQIPVDGEVYLGSRVYMVNCAGCHALQTTTNTADNGPTLGLIFNRKVATDTNYLHYSNSAIQKSFYWTSKNLYNFLANPYSLIPKTKCGVALKPLKQQSDRADLISFLREFSKQLELNTRIELIKREGYEMYQTKLYAQKARNQKIQKDIRVSSKQ